MDESKINATTLGIVFHPELRDISDGAKNDIGKMVRVLVTILADSWGCKFVKCEFADKCDTMCDWAKNGR